MFGGDSEKKTSAIGALIMVVVILGCIALLLYLYQSLWVYNTDWAPAFFEWYGRASDD